MSDTDSGSDDHNSAIVIDNGSSTIKAGLAGDDSPRTIFPAIVGHPKVKNCPMNDHYVGDEAVQKAGVLIKKHPIEHGIITNWDDMEKIWYHTIFNELRVDPEDNPVLLTETSFNSKANKEKTTEIMFETFKAPSFYLANEAALSLYTTGRVTGVVVDSGDTVTRIVPVHEGNIIQLPTKKMDFAGRHLTEYLIKMLNERGTGYSFTTRSDKAFVEDIKEKMCYVAPDFDRQIAASTLKKSYELPDGYKLSLGHEMFTTPEALFKPSLIEESGPGIHETIFECIMSCDSAIRDRLFSNCVLSGGNTMFPGLEKRLEKEVNALGAETLTVIAPPKRKYSVCVGGCILASLSTFQDMCITKEEYEDKGPTVVHTKCS